MAHSPSPLPLALTYLRSAAGWTKRQLARAQELDESLISAYERGAKPLNREQLDSLVETLGHPPEVIDVFLSAHGLIFPRPKAEACSPFALSAEENRAADRASMAAGWTAGHFAAEKVRADFVHRMKKEKTEAAKQQAEILFRVLTSVTRQERHGLVDAFPDYWSSALAIRVCEASVNNAAKSSALALELAELALTISKRVPEAENWNSRLQGYCWAHVGNARRVANDLTGAEQAFAHAWTLWRAGADSDPEILADWVLPSMEASLKRAQRQFQESLALLQVAKDSRGGSSPEASIYLLLQKEHIFDQMGDTQGALSALAEAAPFVEASGDVRQHLAYQFKIANNLYHLEQYGNAAELLPRIRALAVQLGNRLDLIRIDWLTAKIAAGQGRPEDAIAGLEQVRRELTAHELAYEAALSSLDLALIWLEAGRTEEVREMTVAMRWIFNAQGIEREALAALALFCEAACQESATADLVRQVMAEIRVRPSVPPHS